MPRSSSRSLSTSTRSTSTTPNSGSPPGSTRPTPGTARTHAESIDGTRLPDDTTRLLCCDPILHVVVVNGLNGQPLAAGRTARFANRTQRPRRRMSATAAVCSPAVTPRRRGVICTTSSPTPTGPPTWPTSRRCAATTTGSPTGPAGPCTPPPTAGSGGKPPPAGRSGAKRHQHQRHRPHPPHPP